MSGMQEIGLYIIQTLGGLYAAICLLRVLLQLVRADYYNQVSQFIVLATRAPIQALRPILPNWGRLDSAALVWALLVAVLGIQISALVVGFGIVGIADSLTWAFLGLLRMMLNIVFWGLIIVIVLSWLTLMGGMNISHPAINLMNQIIRPFMEPFQRLLPPFGGIDLSPILLFMSIQVLQMLCNQMAYRAGLLPGLVFGY